MLELRDDFLSEFQRLRRITADANDPQGVLIEEYQTLWKEAERLKDQLDAAYDSHASECDKCRVRWAQLRERRKEDKG